MKKIVKILFCFLFIFALGKVKAASSENYELSFFNKVGDDNSPITNAEFKQMTLDGLVLYDTTQEEASEKQLGHYYYKSSFNDKESVYRLLTSEQKEIIDNMKTMSDFTTLKNSISTSIFDDCQTKESFVNFFKQSKGIMYAFETADDLDDDSGGIAQEQASKGKYNVKKLQTNLQTNIPTRVQIVLVSFSYIEEVKTPKGLEKSSAISPFMVSLTYSVDTNGNLALEAAEAYSDGKELFKYDPEIDYNKVSDVYDKMNDSLVYNTTCGEGKWDEYETDCTQAQSTSTIFNTSTSFQDLYNQLPFLAAGDTFRGGTIACIPVIVDKTSSEDLTKKVELTAYVNGKKETRVNKSEEVIISVKAYNGAKTPLYTNKVVSTLPKGFTYVEGSDPKNGVYDREAGTVTWTVDYLDAYNTELFSYKVKSPDNITDGASVRTTATITTEESNVPLVSDEATVDMGNKVTNPETGAYGLEITEVVLGVCILVALLVIRRNAIPKL